MNIFRVLALGAILSGTSVVMASCEPQISFVEELQFGQEWPEKKIVVIGDGMPVGFINYTQLNLSFGWYARYELFIYPEYRSGYLKYFIKHTCSTLVKRGVRKIFVLTGPFEPGDEDIVDDESCAEKLCVFICQ